MPVKRPAGTSSAHPKRTRFDESASTSFAAAASPGGSGSASAADDDDLLLEDDLQQGAARDKQRAKRSLKDTDGYGSDSSNDEEGVVPSRRPGGEKDEDDDVDMFADDVDEKAQETDKGKGKEKEYMDLNEIEGQEFDGLSRNRGEMEDSDSEDEERRKTEKTGLDGPMGSDITPFNMKSEMTEGRFTADGEAYMENDKDENDKHDSWLSDLNREEIKKARRAHRERERLEKEREEKESSGENRVKERELLREAVGLLERGETVLEGLQRLGKEYNKDEIAGKKKKMSWVEKQKERRKLMASEQEQSDPTHTSNPFTNLSNIVSQLTTIGHLEVYSMSRESIQRMLPAEDRSNGAPSSVPAASAPPVDTRQFQYRFSMGYVKNLPEAQRPVEREVFGPFPVQQLKKWRSTGFFGGPACENVEVRLAGDQPGPWGSWPEIVGQ